MANTRRLLNILLLIVLFFTSDLLSEAQAPLAVFRTKLVLDPHFLMQAGAKDETDQINQKVDQLIPGEPPELRGKPVYVSTSNDCSAKGGLPVTVEGPRQLAEEADVEKYGARIYLCGVTVSNTIYGERLAFQLGHELAHVKMGATVDNYLMETFAVGVSFEVLKSLGCFTYLHNFLHDAAAHVSPLGALLGVATKRDVDFAAFYWQLSIARLSKPDPETRKWDYETMALAVLVMESELTDQMKWSSLLGFSLLSKGPPLNLPGAAVAELPDVKQATIRMPALCRLGYVCN